jgi:hypothetical protein
MVSLKKVGNMCLQCDASADALTMLISAMDVVVRLLLLICFSFWDVVRKGGNASPFKKEKQDLKRLTQCTNARWAQWKNS